MACIRTLQPRARRAVEAAYCEGQSRQHIAAELGIAENSVKTLMQRSRAALRACVERRLETN